MLSRRAFLHSTAGLAALAQSPRRKPNIVLILADDLGYECLGCNGATEYKTPRLDAFAASGIRFTDAHSTPLCTPTRVQIMTGKYNHRNYTEFGSLPLNQTTFAHMLRDAGYRTAVTGKWQLAGAIEGTQYKGRGSLPEEAGFDEHCLWQVKDRGSRYWDPLLQVNGKLQPVAKNQYGPDLFNSFAASFIESNRQRPFFLYYPMALTHDPFVPTPDSGAEETERERADPKWFSHMVAYMDRMVGRIVDTVDRHGLGRDTLILFAGDNGTGRGITTQTRNGPVKGGKGTPLRTGTHVPFIARWTGVTPAGKTSSNLVDFTDIMPTLAATAGTKPPSGDGRSFLPQLRGERGDPREWIFCDYNPRWGNFPPARWVMDHDSKLYGDGRFFDLKADPEEKSPIPGAPATRQKFQSVLDQMAKA